jgi:hypothetical protein
MSSNNEVFNFANAIHWDSATLERCNLVYTNGADLGANYVIHIDQMQQDLVVCQSGAGSDRTGSFLVGSEPFNSQEAQTIKNSNPGLALQRLDVHVYDLTGSPATISTAFYFVLKIKERQV